MKDTSPPDDIKDRIVNCPIEKTLQDHSAEFDKKIIKVGIGLQGILHTLSNVLLKCT